MMLALYIIGSAFAILVLAHKLRDTRHQLNRAAWERDAYAAAIQASRSAPPAPEWADVPAPTVTGRALPPAGTVSHSDRRHGQ
jgi:hypothetical protein